MRTLTLICAIVALVPVACSSGQPAPARNAGVATYGPTSQNPPPPPRYVPPTPARPTYAPPPTASTYTPASRPAPAYTAQPPAPSYGATPFRWHTRIADAQAQARRENKLILVGSTQPGCGLCEKFKTRVVPSMAARVSPVCVGYMCHAPKGGISPEAPYIWQQLRANLPNAGLMPLVGIFTPDLRFLTGFGGPADSTQLMNAIATARRLYPVSAPAPVHAGAVPPSTTARLNEYGEYEWSPLEEPYPEPRDALSPDAVVAAEEVLPPAPPADVTPIRDAQPAIAVAPPRAAPPAPAPAALENRPVAPGTVAAPAPVRPAPKPAVAPPPRPPFHKDPEPVLESWGAQALREALARIQAGDLESAKARLAEVRARLPGTPLAREAAKGGVAVYNVGRIQAAEGRERERLRAEAERNLSGSMWGVLFES